MFTNDDENTQYFEDFVSHKETEPDTESIPSSLILVVDDEPTICWAFERMFVSEGHEVVTCSSAEEGLAAVAERKPDLILLDVRLPKQDGLSALPTFREMSEDAPVIIMTAFGDLETAVTAVQQGATDYVTKPFVLEEVKKSCRNALANHLRRAHDTVEDAPAESAPVGTQDEHRTQLVGSSAPMQQVFRQVALVADSDLSVLITGETGTGKELVAAAIHRHSPRNAAPYLPIALVALNDDLIESELFGHVQGAFTGATRDRAGVFEQAEGGTVLLDEIGDLPLATQVKLLRVLDQREYFRVGDVRPRPCNVRILAATNCDLQQAVASGTFREDLFYRLNGLQMHLPPLRERKEDLPALCQHFLSRFSYPTAGALSTELLIQLKKRPWYGNVRELRNAVEHAAVLARGRPIRLEDFPTAQPDRPSQMNAQQSGEANLERAVRAWFTSQLEDSENATGIHETLLSKIEPILFELALEQCGGNRSKAAELLGMHRATLREKLKSLES